MQSKQVNLLDARVSIDYLKRVALETRTDALIQADIDMHMCA